MKDAINAAAKDVSVTVEKVSAHVLGMLSVKLSGSLTAPTRSPSTTRPSAQPWPRPLPP